ncbi:E3 ubiquitin-protein ligase RING1-like [Nicotiana tomentosiformis]|uniref:E3 ubiquitin-protein ligase RING1-like n=1 Tax=Nicotiana tomentosiformis TaxID=4098 RepID=UPI00051C5D38|nr:E3 ubiquitin-protein ligase RING1-like [Nicotiana tomentosiformis]
MDKDFDLDLALTVVGIPESTAEPPRSSTPSDEDEIQVQEFPMVINCEVGLCIVCMEGFQKGVDNGKQVPCGHIFHANCITKWLTICNSCPLCRYKVSAATSSLSVTS